MESLKASLIIETMRNTTDMMSQRSILINQTLGFILWAAGREGKTKRLIVQEEGNIKPNKTNRFGNLTKAWERERESDSGTENNETRTNRCEITRNAKTNRNCVMKKLSSPSLKTTPSQNKNEIYWRADLSRSILMKNQSPKTNHANLLERGSIQTTNNEIFIYLFFFFFFCHIRPKLKRGKLEERSESHLGFTFWISLNSVRINVSGPSLFPSLSRWCLPRPWNTCEKT